MRCSICGRELQPGWAVTLDAQTGAVVCESHARASPGDWDSCNSLPCRHAQFAIAKAELR